jgi:hypothetical protein
MAITRLSGGTSPANGSDPRTFPAIWNNAVDDIEAAESAITTLQGKVSVIEAWDLNDINDVVITDPLVGELLTFGSGGEFVNQALTSSQLPAGSILQVVSTTKTDTFTTAATTYEDVTDLIVAITPSSVNSKILVMASYHATSSDDANTVYSRLVRDDEPIFIGDAAGTSIQASTAGNTGAAGNPTMVASHAPIVLDAPGVANAPVTYKVQVFANGSHSARVGANGALATVANTARLASSITVMEVAG